MNYCEKCPIETHNNQNIIGFCFNRGCQKFLCESCLIQLHNDHLKHSIFRFDSNSKQKITYNCSSSKQQEFQLRMPQITKHLSLLKETEKSFSDLSKLISLWQKYLQRQIIQYTALKNSFRQQFPDELIKALINNSPALVSMDSYDFLMKTVRIMDQKKETRPLYRKMNQTQFFEASKYINLEVMPKIDSLFPTKLKQCYHLINHFKLDSQDFDDSGNIQFLRVSYNQYKNSGQISIRGGWPYYQPINCQRFGLNIWSKYDDGDNSWLGMNSSSKQWAIAYHGVRSPQQKYLSISRLKSIINKVPNLIPGMAQQYNLTESINLNGSVGTGIYLSPHISQCMANYAEPFKLDGTNKSIRIVLQCRINPCKINVVNNMQSFWVVNDSRDVRPYGIILISEEDFNNYPGPDMQYGETFTYSKYQKQIKQFLDVQHKNAKSQNKVQVDFKNIESQILLKYRNQKFEDFSYKINLLRTQNKN